MSQRPIRTLALILISAWLAVFSSHVAFATTEADLQAATNDTNYYDPTDYSTCAVDDAGTGVTPGATPATIAAREKAAFLFFVSKGLTPVQSAAVVGNLLLESGGTLDPAIKQGGGGPGRGIAQWTVGERWKTLTDLAGRQKPPADPITLDWQLFFVWHELNTTESKALKGLRAETTVPAATTTFMNLFERPNKNPSVNHIDRRIRDAQRVLRAYGGAVANTGTTDPDAAPTGDCGAAGGAGGALGSAGGLTFPLITTQKALTTNSGGKWCYKSQSNCHHDYNAADIMIKTGTVVVAAKAGKVTSIKSGITASHLTVKAADTGELYFYQHMGKSPALPVKNGQTVTAGQPLGKVGNRADAFNTDPHLHFDILPKTYNTRPSCTGAGCASLPFINPQTRLIPAFNALPKE